MVNKEQNRSKSIIHLLQKKERMTVDEISKIYNVSQMTIRRDIAKLQNEGFVTLRNGVLSLSYSPYFGTYEIEREGSRNIKEKSKIGEKTTSIIKPNDTIFFDAGSTVPFVIRFIDKDMSINAICYTLKNALELYKRKNISLNLIGGFYNRDSSDFYDTNSAKNIRNFRANKAIISAGGIHSNLGLTTSFQFEAEIKKAMIDSSKERILVADSSKFGKMSSAFFTDLTEIDTIVTDDGIPEKYRKIIETHKIKLLIA
jgi:DeoR family transcriptional regulator, deoxyribose operon repressor